jgi:polyphosphate kinase 2 (PPK2 family)
MSSEKKTRKAQTEAADRQGCPASADALSESQYQRELRRLHAELVKLQQWVVHKGLKVCIIFEGRDGAGKGGTIKAITKILAGSEPREARTASRSAHSRRAKDLEALTDGPEVLQRWYDYSRARDDMFKASDTPWAPWYVIHSDNKKRARLNAISHLLKRIPVRRAATRKDQVA